MRVTAINPTTTISGEATCHGSGHGKNDFYPTTTKKKESYDFRTASVFIAGIFISGFCPTCRPYSSHKNKNELIPFAN